MSEKSVKVIRVQPCPVKLVKKGVQRLQQHSSCRHPKSCRHLVHGSVQNPVDILSRAARPTMASMSLSFNVSCHIELVKKGVHGQRLQRHSSCPCPKSHRHRCRLVCPWWPAQQRPKCLSASMSLVMPAARSPTAIIQQQPWHFCQVPLPRTSCEVNSPIYYDHAINSLIVVGKWGNAQD